MMGASLSDAGRMAATCRFPMPQGSKIARVGSPPVSAFDGDEPFNIYGNWTGEFDIALLTVVEVAGSAAFQRTMRIRRADLQRMGEAARRVIDECDMQSPTLMVAGIEFLRGELRAIERVATQLLDQEG